MADETLEKPYHEMTPMEQLRDDVRIMALGDERRRAELLTKIDRAQASIMIYQEDIKLAQLELNRLDARRQAAQVLHDSVDWEALGVQASPEA